MKTYKASTHQVKYSHYQSIKNGETAYLQLLRILNLYMRDGQSLFQAHS